MTKDHPVILTLAGSDSGGGAGIQADLKTITALGGFGVSVITALTAQNGAEVRGIYGVAPEFITLQYQTVADGFPIRAAKTGMLASAPVIDAVADCLKNKNFPLVADPVCVSQSGHRLLEESALAPLVRRIIPLADLLTPNRPEAELLAGTAVNTSEDVRRAAGRLLEMGAKAVLIKGGHFPDFDGPEHITDWLALPDEDPVPLTHRRVNTPNNHGTGCTLSAAIATHLGFGLPVREAIVRAQEYLSRALASSFSPGIGAGPPNFFV